jgi:hypothetical protein
MRKGSAGLHTLVGAYVMDAVPEPDRIAFERHLGGCEQCREEVRGLREATARLAAAAAIEPRPELREETLLAAARLRQLPPVVASEPAAGRAGPLAWWRARSMRAGAVRQSWLTTATAAAIAFAILFGGAAIGLGLHLTSMQHRLTAAERRDHAIAAVLGAPDATTMTAQARTGGTATVVMSHRAGALVFTANRLPGLPSSKAYELWVMSPAGATAAGMLPAAHGGMSGPMVVSHLAPGDQLGLTVEPEAGSRQPTSVPVVLLGLGA